jgi:hypothetical protein
MKKLLFIALSLFLTVGIAAARNQNAYKNTGFSSFQNKAKDSVESHSKLLSFSYGGPSMLFWDRWDFFGDNENLKTSGPMHIKYEYSVSNKIGLGLNLNFVSSTYSYNNKEVESMKVASILVRLNYHFFKENGLDLYWGTGYGYRFGKHSETYNGTTTDKAILIPYGFELTFGTRYYFNDSFGIFTEFGIAQSLVQGGITFKID